LFDSSGSETTENFQQQVQFLKNFSSLFTIGENDTRFAAATFSTGVRNNFYLNQYHDQQSLQHGLDHIRYLNGETNTHLALNFAKSELLNSKQLVHFNIVDFFIFFSSEKV